MYFCITISDIILLIIVNPYPLETDIGKSFNPYPVRLKVTELDVVAIITIVSNDFNIVDNVLYFFFISFLIYGFCLRKMQSFL